MYENLMEEAVSPVNHLKALQAVVANDGAPGIDGMKAADLEKHLETHWGKIRTKLLAGTYVPTPVRRVEIDKPGGGVRMLGIPTVLDRFIQQLLLQAMTPIFEPLFSDHSYGFRPGRSTADAIQAAKGFARQGKDWVVDLDIAKFFDHVNHDILVARLAQAIRNKRVLGLIGKFLRRGAMVEGVVQSSEEGTPPTGGEDARFTLSEDKTPLVCASWPVVRCLLCWLTFTWTRSTRNWTGEGTPTAATPMTATSSGSLQDIRSIQGQAVSAERFEGRRCV